MWAATGMWLKQNRRTISLDDIQTALDHAALEAIDIDLQEVSQPIDQAGERTYGRRSNDCDPVFRSDSIPCSVFG